MGEQQTDGTDTFEAKVREVHEGGSKIVTIPAGHCVDRGIEKGDQLTLAIESVEKSE